MKFLENSFSCSYHLFYLPLRKSLCRLPSKTPGPVLWFADKSVHKHLEQRSRLVLDAHLGITQECVGNMSF